MGEAWNPEKYAILDVTSIYCSRLKYQVCMEVGTALRLPSSVSLLYLRRGSKEFTTIIPEIGSLILKKIH
jgi:hypothetical protein